MARHYRCERCGGPQNTMVVVRRIQGSWLCSLCSSALEQLRIDLDRLEARRKKDGVPVPIPKIIRIDGQPLEESKVMIATEGVAVPISALLGRSEVLEELAKVVELAKKMPEGETFVLPRD